MPRTPTLNLAGVIRRARGELVDVVPMVNDERGPFGELSLEALAASVRDRFAGAEFAEPTEEAVRTVAGALRLALSLADERRDSQPIRGPRNRLPSLDSVPPPWEVSHPVLLEPVMWLVATAYHQASQG